MIVSRDTFQVAQEKQKGMIVSRDTSHNRSAHHEGWERQAGGRRERQAGGRDRWVGEGRDKRAGETGG
eukprot:SAG11_NODE_5913_length_1434_cov_3.621723_1_plen_67_part_01